MKARIEIPKGWRRVTRGRRKANDMVLIVSYTAAPYWSATQCVGLRIPERPNIFEVVIRRIRPTGQKQQGKTAKGRKT